MSTTRASSIESRTTQHVVPAQPGFTALEPIADETGTWVRFWRHPVVAWRVALTYVPARRDHIDMTVPVTVDRCGPDAPIEYPDGRIVVPEGATFDDEAGVLAYLNESDR